MVVLIRLLDRQGANADKARLRKLIHLPSRNLTSTMHTTRPYTPIHTQNTLTCAQHVMCAKHMQNSAQTVWDAKSVKDSRFVSVSPGVLHHPYSLHGRYAAAVPEGR